VIKPTLRFPFWLLAIGYWLLALSSCKPKSDYTKAISRLDSAETVLVSAEKNLLSVDTSNLRASYNSSANNLHIMGKLSQDTVKKKTALFLTDAYELSGNISNLLNNKKFMGRAISESRQRISDLKHDLNESLIEKNKSDEYIVHEINASKKIYETVNKAIEKAKSSSGKLDSMKTQIAFFADSLNLRKTK
jgi:hypothetical protein